MMRQFRFIGALLIALLGLAHAQNSGTFPQGGGGGGGTPGGANTNVQFNNSGSFGGDAGFNYLGNGNVTHVLGTDTTNRNALTVTGTWNNIATTSASGTGSVATLGFAAQTSAFPVGTQITVAGVTPAGYNGTFSVTASTTTSVSYNNATTGAQTVAGTITTTFDAPLFVNITNTASNGASRVFDFQIGGNSFFYNNNTDGSLTINQLTAAQTGVILNILAGGANQYGFGFSSLGSSSATLNVYNGVNTNALVFQGAGAAVNWGAGSTFEINEANHTLALRDAATGTNAQTYRVYNTADSAVGVPTNYERGILDWNATANQFVVGTQCGGTGTCRPLQIVSGNTNFRGTVAGSAILNIDQSNQGGTTATFAPRGTSVAYTSGNTFAFSQGQGSSTGLVLGTGGVTTSAFYGFSTSAFGEVPDLSLARVAAKVSSFGDGAANANGWYQWGGQARVTADVTQTSTTALANVAGLTVNVAAGRTYSFEADLSWTDAAAGGIQAAIAGTATATNIIYDGWVIDSGANGIKGNAQATALGTAVANTTTTGTAGHLTISGTITVNAAGTLTVQSAQNTSNATSTTIKRGSRFLVYDMP